MGMNASIHRKLKVKSDFVSFANDVGCLVPRLYHHATMFLKEYIHLLKHLCVQEEEAGLFPPTSAVVYFYFIISNELITLDPVCIGKHSSLDRITSLSLFNVSLPRHVHV